ncbi:MAG: tetratricopeptide repeat protein [Pseudomonadota bacterium]
MFDMIRIAGTTLLTLVLLASSAAAQTDPAAQRALQISDTLAALADPEAENPDMLEARVIRLWSQSGSPSADFLLQRGRAAMASGDLDKAIEHLTALTDHAPEFAEGWNARATAFFQMEEYGLSIQDVARTLTLNPNHFGALAGLGFIYERLDRPAQAYAAFEAAHRINPHSEGVEAGLRRTRRFAEGIEL